MVVLQFGDGANQIDDIDMRSAQLICSASKVSRKPLLIVLPDEVTTPHSGVVCNCFAETRIQQYLFKGALLKMLFILVRQQEFGIICRRRTVDDFCLKEIFDQTDLKENA